MPPSVNHLYRISGRTAYKSREARLWQETATLILRQAYKINGGKAPSRSPVALRVSLNARTQRRFDLDNRLKGLQDCLAPAGIIEDDVQVVRLEASVYRGTGQADTTDVEVWALEQ